MEARSLAISDVKVITPSIVSGRARLLLRDLQPSCSGRGRHRRRLRAGQPFAVAQPGACCAVCTSRPSRSRRASWCACCAAPSSTLPSTSARARPPSAGMCRACCRPRTGRRCGFRSDLRMVSARSSPTRRCSTRSRPSTRRSATRASPSTIPTSRIAWPIPPGDVVLSDKDRRHPRLRDLPAQFTYRAPLRPVHQGRSGLATDARICADCDLAFAPVSAITRAFRVARLEAQPHGQVPAALRKPSRRSCATATRPPSKASRISSPTPPATRPSASAART